MSRNDFEAKSLVFIILACYTVNLVFGWLGALQPMASNAQLLLFQVGTACAITASVMAGRYAGLRGQQVAASAYILMGITHGISLAALGPEGVDLAKEATMAMPMIPALLFMAWCSLFPAWVRMLGLVPSLFFAGIYLSVHLGDTLVTWALYAGYATLQIVELLWGIFFFRDWRRTVREVRGQPVAA